MNKDEEGSAFNTLTFVDRIFKDNDIPMWLDEGAALCVHRDGNLLNERDLDMGVFSKDYHKIEKLIPTLKLALGKLELRMMDNYPGVRSLRTYGLKGSIPVKTDIYLWYPGIEYYLMFLNNYYISIPKKFLDKFDTVTYYNTEFKVPSPIESFLEYLYGPTWNTVISVKEWKQMFPKSNTLDNYRPALRVNNEVHKYGY